MIPTMQEVAERVHADHYKGTINGIILAGVIPEYGGEPSIWMNTKADTEWLKWVGVLVNAAREVNEGWEPSENEERWVFVYDYELKRIELRNHVVCNGGVPFKSKDSAVAALVMLNEWSHQQGLGQDGILLRALGVVKGGN